MAMTLGAIRSVAIHQLAIPMRGQVSHAASRRRTSNPIIVAVELNSHVVGFGETHPRPYVTGETHQSAVLAIEQTVFPTLLKTHPKSFPEALEVIDALPWHDKEGSPISAARAAVELALLDVYSRHFERPIDTAAGWLGLTSFGSPGSMAKVRHAGVLATAQLSTAKRQLRMMRWYGLRDIKVKVGDDGDDERVRWVAGRLRRAIHARKATLRIDANGAWTPSQATTKLSDWRDIPIAFVEQPLLKGAEPQLRALRDEVKTPLLHDESLVTMDDAESLVEAGVADGFNIRLSKCGGFLPALRLAQYAHRHDVCILLGCMVGETAILSAAARRFLALTPRVRFAEGNFGTLQLTDDVVRNTIRFGYGGRVKPIAGFGWGIDVREEKLNALAMEPPRCYVL